MYQERKGIFGITFRNDVTPIEQATPEQLGRWIHYWDENRNVATGLLTTTAAIMVGSVAGVVTGEIKLPSSDAIKIGLIGANTFDALLSAVAISAYGAFQGQAQVIAESIQNRGLNIKKGLFARTVELPHAETQ